MECSWMFHGLSRNVHGFLMDFQGMFMDFSWTFHGKNKEFSWDFHVMFKECSWIFHVLLMGKMKDFHGIFNYKPPILGIFGVHTSILGNLHMKAQRLTQRLKLKLGGVFATAFCDRSSSVSWPSSQNCRPSRTA